MELYLKTVLALGVLSIIIGVVVLAMYDKMKHSVKTKKDYAIQLLILIPLTAWVAYLLLENF